MCKLRKYGCLHDYMQSLHGRILLYNDLLLLYIHVNIMVSDIYAKT